jgi:hypothetical protein
MTSDITRNTFDARRTYRAVVMQQGRVTIDADMNEAQTIHSEALRETTRDVVGVVGTPDDGYRVTVIDSDFSIGAGTMYVDGLRLTLENDIRYGAQKQFEWYDSAADPDWIDPGQLGAASSEAVRLHLREYNVSAVEDTTLREVALGGPDTAQRKRIVQHIVRLPAAGDDCGTAFENTVKLLSARGITFDPATMRLMGDARLRVGFTSLDTDPDPCDPEAQGGYLGSENQHIRVAVSGYDAGTGTVRIAWGYDNASYLYRAIRNGTVLTLAAQPVDAYHQPRANQAVEVLLPAVDLGNGDYIAAYRGEFRHLATAYQPDAMTIQLDATLPAQYDDQPVLLVRVWEEEFEVQPDTEVQLGTTGLTVRIRTEGDGYPLGAYWSFAVRPIEPTRIYPQRYVDAFQAPEGPREWTIPLAVVHRSDNGQAVVEDCREVFDNLVELTKRRGSGCCTVTVTPNDTRDLQTILDAASRLQGQKVTVCLQPGVYLLRRPLRLTRRHSNLIIEACHGGAVLRIAPERERERIFLQGMIQMLRADNVTLHGLVFEVPQIGFAEAGARVAGQTLSKLGKAGYSIARRLRIGIAVRPMNCAGLTITECEFRFTPLQEEQALGVGVFASGEAFGVRIERNSFVTETNSVRRLVEDKLTRLGIPAGEEYTAAVERGGMKFVASVRERIIDSLNTSERESLLRLGDNVVINRIDSYLSDERVGSNPPEPQPRAIQTMTLGYVLMPSVRVRGEITGKAPQVEGSVVGASIDNAAFIDNTFERMTAAGVIIAKAGSMRIENNTIRRGYAGFYIAAPEFFALLVLRGAETTQNWRELFAKYVTDAAAGTDTANLALIQFGVMILAADPVLQVLRVLLQGFPLPRVFGRSMAQRITKEEYDEAQPQESENFTRAFFSGRVQADTQPQEGVEPISKGVRDTAETISRQIRANQREVIGGAITNVDVSMMRLQRQFYQIEGNTLFAPFTLHVNNNDIDLAAELGASGPALVALGEIPARKLGRAVQVLGEADVQENSGVSTAADLFEVLSREEERLRLEREAQERRQDLDATLHMTGNKLRNSANLAPCVTVMLFEVCAITGNTIFNEAATPNPLLAGLLTLPTTQFGTQSGAQSAATLALALQRGQRFTLSLLLVPSVQGAKMALLEIVRQQAANNPELLQAVQTILNNAPAITAITGNVLWGMSTLSYVYRAMPAPFNTWVPFNSQI